MTLRAAATTQGPLTRVDRQKGGGARRPALYKVLAQP
jgi:hypothetical protein